MCLAIKYKSNNRQVLVKSDHSNICLPAFKKDGSTTLVTWGRSSDMTGNLPQGHSLHLNDIKHENFNHFSPVPIKLSVCAFAMQKSSGKVVWFELNKNDLLQGVLLSFENERRCYVVLVQSYKPYDNFEFFPRVIGNREQLTLDL